jgi:hypothetical protein
MVAGNRQREPLIIGTAPGITEIGQLDGKDVARGLDAFIEAPRAGRHRLTLAVTHERRKAEQAVTFTTIAVPSEGEEPRDEEQRRKPGS